MNSDTSARPGAPEPEPEGRARGWTSLVAESPVGPLLLAATATGLVRVVFHADAGTAGRERAALADRLGAPEDPVTGAAAVEAARAALAAYFAGEGALAAQPLDWSLVTGFQREVLRALAAGVPFGSVVGYGELARRVGQPGAAQAVGLAMGANPLPLFVACHRVVERDGGIGGFGGGVETKRRLLALEGVLPQPLF
ncbi:methylated-DNA--[protein]-cysteine S-methyltransferase [Streptomyces sp. SPB074]|uniref:methylated-DNA--[protein]-cysteine S-methyltransferase n=1 Tax=Streptomyces sp. (strain SPB074) TaxID=465543 RepID=UPI0001D1DCE6|nr:methylated-DNA--[protein]-cysteine S-methyltransferase [Streptomyces sp. SPB074]EFG65456.1 methylated-DNA-[protein]-cysteine S-methyltransferase [Streptomyces sp. SPB074]